MKSIYHDRLETIYELTFELYPDPQVQGTHPPLFKFPLLTAVADLLGVPPAYWDPETRGNWRKQLDNVQGWDSPETEEIQQFIDSLRSKGVTERQLDYQDYNSAEFNPKTPTRFRIRRGIVSEEAFKQKSDEASHSLGYEVYAQRK